MVFVDLLVAFVIALILVGILGAGLRRLPFGAVLVAMFGLLFLATWAGGVWMAPVGPRVAGSYILAFLVVGLFLGLLLTAFVPPRVPRTRGEALRQADARRETVTFVNAFFWAAIVLLLVVIVARYLF